MQESSFQAKVVMSSGSEAPARQTSQRPQDGPAGRAGMRPGDVVLAIGGTDVSNTAQLLAAVAALKPQSVADVSVQRGTQALRLSLNVAQRPKLQRRAAAE